MFFFFQAEDGIRYDLVTGVQTCALRSSGECNRRITRPQLSTSCNARGRVIRRLHSPDRERPKTPFHREIGRASCRERVYLLVVAVFLKEKEEYIENTTLIAT